MRWKVIGPPRRYGPGVAEVEVRLEKQAGLQDAAELIRVQDRIVGSSLLLRVVRHRGQGYGTGMADNPRTSRNVVKWATMVIRVFLLDDHELVRRGVRDLLWAEEDITVVGEAATAAEALERIPQTTPDVAVPGDSNGASARITDVA